MNVQFDTTKKAIPQGDMYLIPVLEIAPDATPVKPQNGRYILTHSETGHHHVVMERPDVRQYDWLDQFRGFLELSEDALLEHLRSHDTHETQFVPAGKYLIVRQATYTPVGWERARD